MNHEREREIELRIIRKYIKAVLDAGYACDVFDGEETTVRNSRNLKEIVDALRTTDEDYVNVYKAGAKNSFLRFIYGNAPGEVLNDYGVSLEDVLAPVNEYAEKWA